MGEAGLDLVDLGLLCLLVQGAGGHRGVLVLRRERKRNASERRREVPVNNLYCGSNSLFIAPPDPAGLYFLAKAVK